MKREPFTWEDRRAHDSILYKILEKNKSPRGQFETMADNAVAWLKAHPGAHLEVRYNFPANQMFAKRISAALSENKLVPNEAALELILAIGNEPSVLMVNEILLWLRERWGADILWSFASAEASL